MITKNNKLLLLDIMHLYCDSHLERLHLNKVFSVWSLVILDNLWPTPKAIEFFTWCNVSTLYVSKVVMIPTLRYHVNKVFRWLFDLNKNNRVLLLDMGHLCTKYENLKITYLKISCKQVKHHKYTHAHTHMPSWLHRFFLYQNQTCEKMNPILAQEMPSLGQSNSHSENTPGGDKFLASQRALTVIHDANIALSIINGVALKKMKCFIYITWIYRNIRPFQQDTQLNSLIPTQVWKVVITS